MKTAHLIFLADETCLEAGLGVALVARTKQQALLIYYCMYINTCSLLYKIIHCNDLHWSKSSSLESGSAIIEGRFSFLYWFSFSESSLSDRNEVSFPSGGSATASHLLFKLFLNCARKKLEMKCPKTVYIQTAGASAAEVLLVQKIHQPTSQNRAFFNTSGELTSTHSLAL